ncbi:MAG: hypothetical protein DI538_11165 [Azospira oryzae]|nr:MAG: hypothetical protein DI538_11165 [Azospira oryzae]
MKRNIFTLIFLSGTYVMMAQSFHNNGAIVSLSSQTVLTVPDSLVNKGTIINNGSLGISGAWVNLGTYDAGSGQINFNSNLSQTINHSDQAFSKLVISGTGVKTFSANITIESELDLQSSVLKSANGARIILDKNAVIKGGSDQSHIVGSVEAKGAGNWVFPIGNGTTYFPVEVTNVTNANALATLTLHELSNGQVLTADNALTQISSKRYWELIFTAGSLDQSKITLPLVAEDGLATNLDDVVVAESNSITDAFVSRGNSGTSGSLTSGSVTSESGLTSRFYAAAAIRGDHAIEIFNAVSAGNDGQNDFFRIENIEFYPNNHVAIFNRWGDKVFEINGYDNGSKSFNGTANMGGNNKLSPGTFFYSIELGDGSKKRTGYLVLK